MEMPRLKSWTIIERDPVPTTDAVEGMWSWAWMVSSIHEDMRSEDGKRFDRCCAAI